jgi:hypothetical protein
MYKTTSGDKLLRGGVFTVCHINVHPYASFGSPGMCERGPSAIQSSTRLPFVPTSHGRLWLVYNCYDMSHEQCVRGKPRQLERV